MSIEPMPIISISKFKPFKLGKWKTTVTHTQGYVFLWLWGKMPCQWINRRWVPVPGMSKG
jgi:hypothetical protein